MLVCVQAQGVCCHLLQANNPQGAGKDSAGLQWKQNCRRDSVPLDRQQDQALYSVGIFKYYIHVSFKWFLSKVQNTVKATSLPKQMSKYG